MATKFAAGILWEFRREYVKEKSPSDTESISESFEICSNARNHLLQ